MIPTHLEFRNGKISRVTDPPPEWRSKWVEKMGDVAGLPREKG